MEGWGTAVLFADLGLLGEHVGGGEMVLAFGSPLVFFAVAPEDEDA